MRRFAALALLLAPAVGRAADPPEYRVRGDLAIKAREVLRKHCAGCHTGADDPGTSRLKLLDHGQVVGKKLPIPLAPAKGRSLLLDLVTDGSMPPANRPGPTADEVATLAAWAKAGAPAYPEAFDEEYVLNAVAEDMEQTERKGLGVNFFRHVSFAHLIRDGGAVPDLAAAERQLLRAFEAAVPDAKPKLEPADAAGTVFRVAVNSAGWSNPGRFVRVAGRTEGGPSDLRPFDLLLLEYPHAVGPAADAALRPRLDRLFAKPGMGRSVPFVRGDWLADVLRTDDRPTPLAAELGALTALGRVKSGAPAPDGPDPKPFAGAKPLVVPAATDGRKVVPPLSAWYSGDVTPAKPPFRLTAVLVAGDKPIEKVKVGEPFHLRVACDKNVHFTLLFVQADGEVRVQPVLAGTALPADKPRRLSPNGEGFVISGIVTGGDSAVEHLVLFASEEELPLPTIVRSKHGDKPIWRFLMEPTERHPFNPNAVVRKVIPIPVTRK